MRCYQQRAEFRVISSTECPGSLAKLYTMMIGQDFLDIPYHICTGKEYVWIRIQPIIRIWSMIIKHFFLNISNTLFEIHKHTVYVL